MNHVILSARIKGRDMLHRWRVSCYCCLPYAVQIVPYYAVLCCAVLTVLSADCSGRCRSVSENPRENAGTTLVVLALSEDVSVLFRIFRLNVPQNNIRNRTGTVNSSPRRNIHLQESLYWRKCVLCYTVTYCQRTVAYATVVFSENSIEYAGTSRAGAVFFAGVRSIVYSMFM